MGDSHVGEDESETGTETDPETDAQSLLSQARPPTDDVVADVARAKVRHGLLGDAAAPAKIGRFSVLHFVGAGAAGTVYAAYDPVLDRKVALKVLSPTAATQEMLLEEARALAQLRHPNVVAVHEVGEIGAQVYLAMEFVEGETLRAWLASRDREPNRVIETLRQAGEGLAAAHKAGIAHGDFKPDNVLVGIAGARVVDFGMSRRLDTHADAPGGGTPAYMAPERFRGGGPTEAADQFSFGVSLVEALTGARPFDGRTGPMLHTQAERGEPNIPRGDRRTQAALQAARRAVAAAPEARFASMADLLEKLAPPVRVVGTQRRILLAAGLATVAAIGVQQSARRDPCAGGDDLANAVAGPENLAKAKRALGAAVDNTEGPRDASTRVEGRLRDYRTRWVAAHRAACEATRVDGTQSDTLYDIRMRCLERKRQEFGALAEALANVASEAEATRALSAVDELPQIDRCDADQVAAADYRDPEDFELRGRVDAVRRSASAAWADYRLARYSQALRAGEAIDAEAVRLAFKPLVAETRFMLGTMQSRVVRPTAAEATLREARVLAATAGADGLAADISVQLLRTVMFGGDAARVRELADFVRADVARAKRAPGDVDAIVGEARLHAGDALGALAAISAALDSEERAHRRAFLLANRASALLLADKPESALTDYERALEVARGHYGASHPTVSFFVHRVGRGQLAAGHPKVALQTLITALAQRERALGPDDRAVASTLVDLAKAARANDQVDLARASLNRALAIRHVAYGDDHPRVGEVIEQLAALPDTAGEEPPTNPPQRAR